jgi:hypothetical protein
VLNHLDMIEMIKTARTRAVALTTTTALSELQLL